MISDIRDQLLNGEITPEMARVAIDACKWSAGKRQPKKYGDKLDIETKSDVNVRVVIGGTNA